MNADSTVNAAQRHVRQAEVVAALLAVLPTHALLWNREDTVPYECDGLTAYRASHRWWPCPKQKRL